MKRTLIQFDEDTYLKLRQRAYEQSRSMSSVVRELVAKGLVSRNRKKFTISDFKSVGAGQSKQGRLAPVSIRHDEALAEIYGDFLKKRKK